MHKADGLTSFPPVHTTSTSSYLIEENQVWENPIHHLVIYLLEAITISWHYRALDELSCPSIPMQFNKTNLDSPTKCYFFSLSYWLKLMLASLYCKSQKASTKSSQISTYLNLNRELGFWENPVLLQVQSTKILCDFKQVACQVVSFEPS